MVTGAELCRKSHINFNVRALTCWCVCALSWKISDSNYGGFGDNAKFIAQ